MTAQRYFEEEMHDRIDESSNDARFSYWYKDYQLYKSAWSLNWFEDRFLFEVLLNQFENRRSFRHFELKISSSLRFNSEISLFDLNE
jgi:hypothetical protein